MLKIIHPITGGEVQVAQNDFPEKMTWGEALRSCNALGSGWRLPTKEELEAMYKQLHVKGQGNLKESFYWSSTEDDDTAWLFDFDGGFTSDFNKHLTHFVRAVRAF